MAGVQIPIEVVDKFSKQLSDMEKRLDAITKAAERQQARFDILAADVIARYGGQALSAIQNFAQESIKQFREQEEAQKRLEVAMKNLGVFTQDALEKNIEFAASIQRTTTFSDDQVIGIQSLLTTFGLYGQELERVTKAALDLSVAQRIDLHTAALMLGKAFVGETGSLGRFGLVISETGTRAERFEQLLRLIGQRFGGSATAEIETQAGAIKQLGNEYADLQKKIGAILADEQSGFIGWARAAIKVTDQLITKMQQLGSATDLDKTADRASNIAVTLVDWAARLGIVSGAHAKVLELVTATAKVAQEAAPAAAAAGGAPPPEPRDERAEVNRQKLYEEITEREFALAAAASREIEQAGMTESQILDLKAERFAGELRMADLNDAADGVLQARRLQREKDFNRQRLQNFSSTLNAIATLATANNAVLAGIGKAAAISQATIDTYRAANVALASAPPPFNFGLAALVVTAGLANVAKIAGVQLEQGGLVPGSPGGTAATIGEKGKREAVLPLTNVRAMRDIGGAIADAGGLGGGPTINFNGGINVVVQANNLGDPADRQTMLEQLTEEIRNAASSAVDFSVLTVRLANQHSLRAA